MRPVAGRSRPDLRTPAPGEPGILESRLRLAAKFGRDGRKPGRSCSTARRNAVLCRAPHHRAGQVPARRGDRDDQRSRQMTTQAYQSALSEAGAPDASSEHIAPAPRVSVQAFCETVETAAAVQAAGDDRRLGKAHLKIQMGGITAAVEAYSSSPTPNVIVIESESGDDVLAGLDSLADV